jgi:hypothetical protein
MKNIIIFLSIISIVFTCNSQNNTTSGTDFKNVNFIRNSAIKYSLVFSSCDSCVPIMTKGYRISTNITTEQLGIANKLTYSDWLNMLNSSKSDWAANLILYQIFDKDAVSFFSFNNRSKWIKYFKGQDIEYWNQKLKPAR